MVSYSKESRVSITKQKPSLAKMLTTMYRIYSQHMSAKIGHLGLNLTDLAIIMSLSRSPGRSLNGLAKHKRINKAILSKSLKKLEKEGLIDLEKDEDHKQRFKIFLSAKAKKLVPQIRTYINEYEALMFDGEVKTNVEAFRKMFEKLYKKEVDPE